MQDPVDAQVTYNLSGWIVGDDFYFKASHTLAREL